MSLPKPRAKFPEKLECLFHPARYKILYGGRGGAKSWGVARALLIMASARPLRILCSREIQRSMKDSVHRLLSDQIASLGLSANYKVLADEIRGINGSEFVFAGLRHNVDSIKSKEGIDIVWVEEAQTVSKSSWDKLIPTIRKADSEIWVTFNPELETDETYKRFVASPPNNAVVVKLNYIDNPWFPKVLNDERLSLQAKDPDAYLTVWEGHCRQALDGAIYANELRDATSSGRIIKVARDLAIPVNTYWDLGRADMTSIWFVQSASFEHRVIDFYENHGFALDHYLKVLQDRGYLYGDHHLPHDSTSSTLGAQKTIKQQVEAVYPGKVRVVPQIGVANGINAARAAFGRCWFDAEKCADGLNALRHYQYKVHPDTGQRSAEPLHNWASHAADAFRYFGVALQEPKIERTERRRVAGGSSWMGA